MTTTTDELSLEAYAALVEPSDAEVSDLVRGRVVREPRPGARHGRIQVQIARWLGNGIREHAAGEVLAESGFILSEEPPTVRGPDVAVLFGPQREPAVGGWIRGSPDIAVEVLSPSDTSSGIQQKVLDYLEAGGARVWVVDPQAGTVTVYRADGSAALLRGADTLRDEELLPGFALPLAQLFE